MRAAISGPLKGRVKKLMVDRSGARHLWKTIESLIRLGAVEVVKSGKGYHTRLTELGMLAALWLEQEATMETFDG